MICGGLRRAARGSSSARARARARAGASGAAAVCDILRAESGNSNGFSE